MVCDFGLGPEGVSWLAASGAAGLKRLPFHQGVQHVDNAVAWWRTEPHGVLHKDASLATSFDSPPPMDDHAAAAPEGAKGSTCFPSSATVYVKGRGPICVVNLQTEDLVLTGDADSSSLTFSPFIGHLHFETAVVDEYIAIETTMDAKAGSRLTLSREHLLFASSSRDGRAIAVCAGEVRQGDWLCRVSCDGDLQRAQIIKVSTTRLQGRICPLTQSGTIVVESSLCSCYVDPFVENAPAWLRRLATTQEVAHTVLLPLRLMAGLGVPVQDARSADDTQETQKGLHPYLRKLMALPAVGKVV